MMYNLYVSVKISNLRWLVLSVAILIYNSNSTFIVLNHCPRSLSKDIARVTHYGKQSSILMETMGIYVLLQRYFVSLLLNVATEDAERMSLGRAFH